MRSAIVLIELLCMYVCRPMYVVTMASKVYGKTQSLTPCRSETPKIFKQKLD